MENDNISKNKYDSIKLENQLCFCLYALSKEVIRIYKPFLDKYGLTYTQYLAMLVLWEDETATIKQIGEKLHLDSGTLTPVIKKLETSGFITKSRDCSDDRIVRVSLTKKAILLKDDILEVPFLVSQKLGMNRDEFLGIKDTLDELMKKLLK